MSTTERSTSFSKTAGAAANDVSERIRQAETALNDTVEDLGRKGREAAAATRDSLGELDSALRETVRERPYTALAVAALIGFLFAVARR